MITTFSYGEIILQSAQHHCMACFTTCCGVQTHIPYLRAHATEFPRILLLHFCDLTTENNMSLVEKRCRGRMGGVVLRIVCASIVNVAP